MDARTLCLGIIHRGPATGYDIKKTVEQGPFQHFFSISYGSIYPTLNQLLADGLIEIAACDQPVGGHPSKRRFRLSPAGEAALHAQLAQSDSQDRLRSEFFLALYFFDQMLPADQHALLDRRLTMLRASLAEIEAQSCALDVQISQKARKAVLLGFAHHIRSAEITYLEALAASLAAAAPAAKPKEFA